MREKVSACITAGNEEKNIRRCLDSVKWADEIIVVDSFSTDRTVEICREYTNRVYSHRWLGYIGQKNLIKDLADGPWILFIDADEEISESLRDEIIAELESDSCNKIAGYEFTRLVKFLGRWIKHGDWYPDIKLRIFRKDRGHCGGKEPHDKTTVNGPVKHLHGDMYHYTYDEISDQLETINRFSSITANGQYADKKTFHMHDLLLRPIIRFIRSYIFRRGFMDGLPGLIIAMTCSYGVFVKYAKLWEKGLHKTPSS
ncbi:MAG: glycosyltransferase family 2 protein [Kiritimatiellae bacterium]|nr:glycosyltransferase family 2 protein [Kiritimatiellia bacterium]